MNYRDTERRKKSNKKVKVGEISKFGVCFLPSPVRSTTFLFLSLCGLMMLGDLSIPAQDLPDRIRGYKLQRAQVSVKNKSDNSAEKIDAEVSFGDPVMNSVSPFGIDFELPAEITSREQKAQIDFLTFQNFRVNGLRVNVEEYRKSFKIEKNQTIRLADPVKLRVSFAQAARGVFQEWRDSKPIWTVTGTVFVFGRFKKSFLGFKRVVPVEINLKIKNPLIQQAVSSR